MLIALLIVGPDRLPRLAAETGKWVGKIRRLAASFKDELAQEIDRDELKKTIGLQNDELQSLKEDFHQVAETVNRDLRDLDPVAKSMEEQIDKGRFVSADMTDALIEEPILSAKDTAHDMKEVPDDKDKGTGT